MEKRKEKEKEFPLTMIGWPVGFEDHSSNQLTNA